MKISPNSNFSLTVHQAHILTPISSLMLSPQVSVEYNNTQIHTKVGSGLLPVFNETFNFELAQGALSLTLLNNPKFFKSSTIATCSILVTKQSGWFDLTKEGSKIGSIRLTLIDDSSNTCLLKDYQAKLTEAKTIQEEVKSLKKQYLQKMRTIREKSLIKQSNDFDDIENNDQTARSFSVKQEMKEVINRKALIKLQEDHLEQEKIRIQESWKEIETEKKEMEEMISKLKESYQESQVARLKNNLLNRISEYSKSRTNTPKSAKSRLCRTSELSLSQPRIDE